MSSRTRSRSKQTTCYQTEYTHFGPVTRYYGDQCSYEQISDYNNRTARPESSVSHGRCDLGFESQTYMESGFFGPYPVETNYWNRPASRVHSILDALAMTHASAALSELKGEAYKQFAEVFERFSLLNVFAELGDVAGMAHGLGRKALSKAEFQRVASEVNYLEWEFGAKPMIQDALNLMNRLTATKKVIESKLEAMSKPIKFSRRITIPFNASDEVMFFNNDVCKLEGAGSVSVKVRGMIYIVMPRLPDFDRDWYIWLDQVGLHPDMAAVWEAIPFSWFADYFLPIGNTLEGLSGNWYSPTIEFVGNATIRWRFVGDVLNWNGPFSSRYKPELFRQSQATVRLAKGYYRTPLEFSRGSRYLEALEPSFPELDARKAAIGASIVDLPRGVKHRVRSKIRRARAAYRQHRSRNPILRKR